MSKNWVILLAISALIPLGCLLTQESPAPAGNPRPTEATAHLKATVDAAVTATIQAAIVNATPEQTSTPQPILTPFTRPTPTPIPQPTLTPTPRPTLKPVNTAAKRAKTITTSLGQQVDVTVQGFDDSRLRFNQLVQAINEGERILGVPYPSPRVTMKRARTLSGGFCGHNQMSYAPRYVGYPYVVDNSIIKVRVDKDCDKTFASIAHETAHTWFHGNRHANWIDEGLANTIEYQILETHPEDRETYPPTTNCESYRNISELVQLPLECALYQIPVSPAHRSRASWNP